MLTESSPSHGAYDANYEKELSIVWQDILKGYSQRELTIAQDKEVTISGIAKAVAASVMTPSF
jgi:hypothetical protein